MSYFYLSLLASLPLVLAGAQVPVVGSVSVSASASVGSAITTPSSSYQSPKQCIRDGCARQVVDGLQYQSEAAARSADCAALFQNVTVTPSAVTITVTATPSARATTVTSSVATAVVTNATAVVTTTDRTATSTTVTLTTSSTITTQVDPAFTTVTTTTTTSIAAATITAKFGKRDGANVPEWACDCPDTTRLSSACACAGVHARTVTAAASTVTETVTVATPTSTVYVVGQTTEGATGEDPA